MIATSPSIVEEQHHKELRTTLRNYLERHATTEVMHRLDREGIYPAEIVAGLVELGIAGATIPEEYGGAGADLVSVAISLEEMQRAGGALSSAFAPTMTFCAPAILWHGNEEQRRRLLPGIAAGEIRMGIGLSEPDAASDLGSIAMRARPVDGGFLVSGTKVWCTGAEVADYVVSLVRSDPGATGYRGMSMLLVPTDLPEVSVRKIPKFATQATASCEVFVDDAFVPEENLLGELHEGSRILWSLLDSERIYVAAQAVGLAQGAFDFALAYAQERRQFGKPVIEHQAIGHTLADMSMQVAMARLLAYTAVAKADAGEPYSLEATQAKVACTEIASSVVEKGMKVMGSYSYSVEYPMERFYRECKLYEIAGGTNHILRNVIVKRLGSVRR